MRTRLERPAPPRLYVILDHDTLGDDEAWLGVVGDVAAALDGRGEAMLQLRVKSPAGGRRLRLLERGCARARRRDVTVLVNGSLAEARRAGAHGAHWPEALIPHVAATDDDGDPGSTDTTDAARPAPHGGAVSRSGPDPDRMLRAASVHSVAAARRALAAEADFAAFGPVFDPGSKPGRGRGLDALARVADATTLPILALGGVDAGRVAACLEHGARGVATVSAVVCREDPAAAALQLLEALRKGGNG